MKLVVLGGGGFRVPLVYRALLTTPRAPRVDEIVLHDLDPQRLAAIAAVLGQIGAAHHRVPTVRATGDLEDALDGADVVFSAIRTGGLSGRVADERVALDLGVLGQETTGPGGLAFGMRTVPVALHIAEVAARRCPSAWFINFTNPAGMITEALQSVLGDRVVGICDSPMVLARRAARALGCADQEIVVDYAGLNHLGWLQGLSVGGRDRLADLVGDTDALRTMEEGQLFGAEWIQTLGVLPNEYLYYYYFTRDAITAIAGRSSTRGEYLLMQQGAFYRRVLDAPELALPIWDRTRLERNATYMQESRGDADERHPDDVDGGGYEGVAVALIAALLGGEPAQLILNVRNGATLADLPADAVVEVTCQVDERGPRPMHVTPLTGEMLGLVQQVKAVERLAIRASQSGSRTLAVRALAVHPLVDSVTTARQLFDGYRERIPELATVFGEG